MNSLQQNGKIKISHLLFKSKMAFYKRIMILIYSYFQKIDRVGGGAAPLGADHLPINFVSCLIQSKIAPLTLSNEEIVQSTGWQHSTYTKQEVWNRNISA